MREDRTIPSEVFPVLDPDYMCLYTLVYFITYTDKIQCDRKDFKKRSEAQKLCINLLAATN